MQSLSRHFPLFLDEPGELGPVRLTTNRTVAALADIVEESEFQFGSLTGRLCYRRGHGVLFVFAYLGNVCPCLQAALGLEEFQQIRIEYPADKDLGLRSLYEFLALKTGVEVILEVPRELQGQVRGLVDQLDLEYRQAEQVAPVRAEDVRQAADALLTYGLDAQLGRLQSCLHTLRHLAQVDRCLEVMEIHEEFYRGGSIHTHKTYVADHHRENVAENLEKLYHWARTPAWEAARNTRDSSLFPLPWMPQRSRVEPKAWGSRASWNDLEDVEPGVPPVHRHSKLYPLYLSSPTELGPLRFADTTQALGFSDIVERYSFQYGGGEGEFCWRRHSGTLFVFPELTDFGSCIRFAASLIREGPLRLTYPGDNGLSLRSLYEFLDLGNGLEIILEVGDHRDQVEGNLQQLEAEYSRAALRNDHTLAEAKKVAAELLEYDREARPEHVQSRLHYLRHLKNVEVCRAVMNIHQEFYQQGARCPVKSANLERLYLWADTTAWRKARRFRDDQLFPTPWHPDISEMQLGPETHPGTLEYLVREVLGYGKKRTYVPTEQMEAVRSGDADVLERLLSDAASGHITALSAVVADPEPFGAEGARHLLAAYGSKNTEVCELLQGWPGGEESSELKLRGYFLLRQDQALRSPPLDERGAEPGTVGLYRILTGRPVDGLSPEQALETYLQHRCFVLDQRLEQKLTDMNDSWARVFAPVLATKKAVERARSISWTDEEKSTLRLAFARDVEGSSQRLYLRDITPILIKEDIVAFHRDMLVSLKDDNEFTVRRFNGCATESCAGGYWSAAAYAPGSGLLAVIESSVGSVVENTLNITYLPISYSDSEGPLATTMLPARFDSLEFSPRESFLVVKGYAGCLVYRVGEWDKPAFSGGRPRGLSFSEDEQWFAVSFGDSLKLVSSDSFEVVAECRGLGGDAFIWKGNHLVVRGRDWLASLVLPELRMESRMEVAAGTVVLCRDYCLIGADSGPLQRYEIPGLQSLGPFALEGVRALALGPDNRVLAVFREVHGEGVVTIYCGDTLEQLYRSRPLHIYSKPALHFSSDGRHLLCTGGLWAYLFKVCAGHDLSVAEARELSPAAKVGAIELYDVLPTGPSGEQSPE